MQKEENQQPKKHQKFDLVPGHKYGRLAYTGVSFFKEDSGGTLRRMLQMKCECGTIKDCAWYVLKRGEILSCGCLRREAVSERMSTHHRSKHPLYITYVEMKQRCYNPNNKSYHNYGGRGISVAEEWKLDFQPFYDWAISKGWKKGVGLELDREENDGNYGPDNCRWVKRDVQSRNKRTNRWMTAFGEVKCFKDWANDPRCVVDFSCLRSRIDRGWKGTFEQAMTTPLADRGAVARNKKKGNRYLEAFGEKKCMTEWLEDPRCLVKIDSFRDRMAKGWSAERAMSEPPTRDGKNTK